MFGQTNTARFIWGPRGSTASDCSSMLWNILVELGRIDRLFGQWKGLLREAEKWIPLLKRTSLDRVVEQGVNRKDVDRMIIPELGYRGIWMGVGESEGITFSYSLGSTVPQVPNVVLLGLPPIGHPAHERVWRLPVLMDIAQLIVDNFSPSDGCIYSDPFDEHVRNTIKYPFAGWITYLSSMYPTIKSIPAGIDHRPTAGGNFYVVHDQPFADDNAIQIAAARALRKKIVRMRPNRD